MIHKELQTAVDPDIELQSSMNLSLKAPINKGLWA